MFAFLSSVPARAFEWAKVGLLSLNLAWTTLCLGGFRAETMVVTTVLTALLLLVQAASLLAGRGVDGTRCTVGRDAWWVGGAFVAFLGYAAANVQWVTPVRWLGWLDWFGWAQMLAIFWVVSQGVRSRGTVQALWAVLLALAGVAVLLGGYQYFVRPDWLMLHRVQADQYLGRASGCFGIPNSLGAYLVLILPVCLALTLRRGASAIQRVFFGWLSGVLIFGLALTVSRGAWLALAVALCGWSLAASHSWRRRVVTTALVIAALSVAVAVGALSSPLIRGRLEEFVRQSGERTRPILWKAAWRIIEAHPVVGSGAGSFDIAFEPYRPAGFLRTPKWAHSDYLNTLSDYGLAGFVLLFGGIAVVVSTSLRSRRRRHSTEPRRRLELTRPDPFSDPLVGRAQCVGLAAFALHLLVDFHLKIPALAMTLATIGGLALRPGSTGEEANASEEGAPASRTTAEIWAARSLGYAFAAAGLLTLLAFTPRYQAEALRERARESIDLLADIPVESPQFRERIMRAYDQLSTAVTLAPADAQAWADRSYATVLRGHIEPAQAIELGRRAEAHAERALQLCPLIAEFWIRRGVARDVQKRWFEAGADFNRALMLSPKTPLPWFHQAYHLSLDATGRELAEAMVQTCLRLDPANREAIRLRQHLASGPTGP